jgi:hypothetical protein
MDNPVFKHPFTMCVSGSTGSGKTEWIMRFLENLNLLVHPPIHYLLYCYGEVNQNIYKLQQLENRVHSRSQTFKVKTHEGVPDLDFVRELATQTGGHLLMVLDDLMIGLKAEFLDIVFTRGSHNWGLSVVLVTQHLFNRELRTARNNSHYLCLMRNPAGALQIRNLGVQIFPTQTRHFMESYGDATREKFGYLLVDLHPKSDEEERLKTNIYPGEYLIFYVPKK